MIVNKCIIHDANVLSLMEIYAVSTLAGAFQSHSLYYHTQGLINRVLASPKASSYIIGLVATE